MADSLNHAKVVADMTRKSELFGKNGWNWKELGLNAGAQRFHALPKQPKGSGSLFVSSRGEGGVTQQEKMQTKLGQGLWMKERRYPTMCERVSWRVPHLSLFLLFQTREPVEAKGNEF